jgi:hypothetical protein
VLLAFLTICCNAEFCVHTGKSPSPVTGKIVTGKTSICRDFAKNTSPNLQAGERNRHMEAFWYKTDAVSSTTQYHFADDHV